MQIELKTLKDLILAIEPNGVTETVLSMNGYGRTVQIHDQSTYWMWYKDKIYSLDEEGLNQLIKHIVWS